jgi:hypothetical protein
MREGDEPLFSVVFARILDDNRICPVKIGNILKIQAMLAEVRAPLILPRGAKAERGGWSSAERETEGPSHEKSIH